MTIHDHSSEGINNNGDGVGGGVGEVVKLTLSNDVESVWHVLSFPIPRSLIFLFAHDS